MAYRCFDRSPYGIREPAVKPPVLPGKPNWMQRMLHLRQVWFPTYEQMQGDKVQSDSANTIVNRKDSYSTKLAAQQTGPNSGPSPYPIREASTDMTYPWPQGTPFGPPEDQKRKRDYPHIGPDALRPTYQPMAAPYMALKSSTPGFAWDPHAERGATPREDLIPVGGRQQMFRFTGKDVVKTVPSDPSLGYGLDFGPAPWRVPMMRKTGLSLMAGTMQFGQQQQYSGVAGVAGPSGSILAAPPVWGDVTRGSRGVSGILQRVQGPGRSNVPGVFVPSEVR